MKLPCKVTVKSVLSSRYGKALPEGHSRPQSWDDRTEGVDTIVTECGSKMSLLSDGGQSTPQKGWVILLTEGSETSGYRWTLFGMPKGVAVHTM